MACFLFYTAVGTGRLYPLVRTLRELREHGHDVVVCTEQEHIGLLDWLELRGDPVDPAIEAHLDAYWRAGSRVEALGRTAATRAERAELEVADLREAVRRHQPDVVVVDCSCWGAAAAAATGGTPWAQLTTALLPLAGPGTPPFGLGLRPASGWWAGGREAALRVRLRRAQAPALGRVNAVRAGLGLPAVADLADLYVQAPLVLSYSAPPLEQPAAALPTAVRCVGADNWDPDDQPVPDWLTELQPPLVLVTRSTVYQKDAALIQVTLDALADAPVSVVATTASRDPARYRVPGNAVVRRFVPHRMVLSRAACAVGTGTVGVTQKALLAGVPVCVVPMGRDQFEVARRVESSGAGVRLEARRLHPGRLRLAVEAAIARQAAAADVAPALRSGGGAAAAVTALESLIAG